MLVLLVPCYLGYAGDSTQGWWDELLNSNNSIEKSLRYGRFLGSRYTDFPNIIWVAGGDNDGKGQLYGHMSNVITGIKEHDKYYWTGHFDNSTSNWSSDNSLYASVIDINGLYEWTEGTAAFKFLQYEKELDKFAQGKMIFQLDQSYEHDVPNTSDNEDYQWIRHKNYDGILSGCAGTSFGPGEKNNRCYTFKNSGSLMNTRGMRETCYCFDLFESRAWQDLVPDQNSLTLIDGSGIYGEINFVCAARTRTGSTFIAYVPNISRWFWRTSRIVTVNMSRISGTKAKAWWYNRMNGQASLIGSFTTVGYHDFIAEN